MDHFSTPVLLFDWLQIVAWQQGSYICGNWQAKPTRNTVPIHSTQNQNPTPHSLALSFKFRETLNSSLWLLLIITLLLLYSCQSKPLIMRFPHESNMLIRCECQHRCTTLQHQTFFKCSGILFCVDHPSMIGMQWMDGHDHEADTTRLRANANTNLFCTLAALSQ